jgi:hypothetical protein
MHPRPAEKLDFIENAIETFGVRRSFAEFCANTRLLAAILHKRPSNYVADPSRLTGCGR